MYQFRSVTDRIRTMRELVRDRMIQVDSERAVIVTEAYQRYDALPSAIKRAKTTNDIFGKMTLRVEDEDIFVGNKSQYFCGAPVFPEWEGHSWVIDEVKNGSWEMKDDGLYHNPETDELRMAISQTDLDNLLAIDDFWKTHTLGYVADSWKPRGYDVLCDVQACANNNIHRPLMSMSAGHLTAGFQTIINKGYGAIRAQAEDWLDSHRNFLMGDDAEACLFYESASLVCDAAETLLTRYSEACEEKAQSAPTEERKQELLTMAASLKRIATEPAQTFWEACQAALIYQMFITLDSKIPASSFGRFDQYTYPFLKRELDEGTITLDQAQEYVDAFFLKAGTYYVPAHPAVSVITGIGNSYQHTTIGGLDPETGKDASNPVTYMTLESMSRLLLHDPTISLRTSKDTPDELWDCAIETSKTVGGLPLYMNDDVIIPGIMRELKFSEYDARNYALIGC